jgi:hypothetical protein
MACIPLEVQLELTLVCLHITLQPLVLMRVSGACPNQVNASALLVPGLAAAVIIPLVANRERITPTRVPAAAWACMAGLHGTGGVGEEAVKAEHGWRCCRSACCASSVRSSVRLAQGSKADNPMALFSRGSQAANGFAPTKGRTVAGPQRRLVQAGQGSTASRNGSA